MRTIGHHWPRSAPKGDHRVRCGYCGVEWPRSKMRRDGAGLLVCPDEGPGRDIVTLSMLQAEAGQEPRGPTPRWDSGPADGDPNDAVEVHITDPEDIYA